MELYNALTSISSDDKYYKIILDSYVENELLQANNSIRFIISHINEKLTSPATRTDSLVFLNKLLPKCPVEIVNENGLLWINICMKNIDSKIKIERVAGFIALKTLLEITHENHDLTKSVSANYFSKLVHTICSCSTEAALECLEACLKYYPGPCGNLRNNIEKYLIQFVDSVNISEVNLAARCLHLLQQVIGGGGGQQRVNHKMLWVKQQNSLCDSLHYLLNSLFEHIMEINNCSTSYGNCLNFPNENIEGNVLLKTHITARRFNNCIMFLQEMLLGAFPVVKSIDVDLIIQLICRVIAVNNNTVGTDINLDLAALCSVLPNIHKSVLQLLETLILCVQTNLLPYSNFICNVTIKTLEWTTKAEEKNEKMYIALRIQAYKTLSTWVSVSKGGCCIDLHCDTFIPLFLSDVIPWKEDVKLVFQGQGHKHIPKKLRKNIQKAQFEKSPIAQQYAPGKKCSNLQINKETELLCTEAVKTIQNIIKTVGVILPQLIYKKLQEFTVKQLLDINIKNQDNIYRNETCRTELYNLLMALTTNPHPLLPSITHYTVQILSQGTKDNSYNISNSCLSSLTILENLYHPAASTLYFAEDKQTLNEILEEEISPIEENIEELYKSFNGNAGNELNEINNAAESEDVEIEEIIDISSNNEDETVPSDSITIIDCDKDELAMKEVLLKAVIENESLSETSDDEVIIESKNTNKVCTSDANLIWEVETEVLDEPIVKNQTPVNGNKDVGNLSDFDVEIIEVIESKKDKNVLLENKNKIENDDIQSMLSTFVDVV